MRFPLVAVCVAAVACSTPPCPTVPSLSAPTEIAVRGPVPPVQDPFLDALVGRWQVTRLVRGETVQNSVDAEWVLGHQFVRLHYLDAASPREYEALVFIGPGAGGDYLAYWLDVFGGKMSARGQGVRKGNTLDLVFDYPDGPFHNEFAFDPVSGGWTSLMRQKKPGGEWTVFAEDRFERLRK